MIIILTSATRAKLTGSDSYTSIFPVCVLVNIAGRRVRVKVVCERKGPRGAVPTRELYIVNLYSSLALWVQTGNTVSP